jgi:hypothetical protein
MNGVSFSGSLYSEPIKNAYLPLRGRYLSVAFTSLCPYLALTLPLPCHYLYNTLLTKSAHSILTPSSETPVSKMRTPYHTEAHISSGGAIIRAAV